MGRVAAGRLNKRVHIQTRAGIRDEGGQPCDIWVHVATVWAHVRMQRGSEFVSGGTELSVAKGSIRIRKRPGVTADMRVVVDHVPYDIIGVLPDEEGNEYIDLAVAVGGNHG